MIDILKGKILNKFFDLPILSKLIVVILIFITFVANNFNVKFCSIGLVILVFIVSKKYFSPIKVLNIKKIDKLDQATRIFEIALGNNTHEQILLNRFILNWQYIEGMCTSIAFGLPLEPAAEYILEFPLDVNSEIMHEKEYDLTPLLVVPPKNENGRSLTMFKIQLHYDFFGRLNYHPCWDWNIQYNLMIKDVDGRIVTLIKDAMWRDEESIRLGSDLVYEGPDIE